MIQTNFDFDWKGAGETLRKALALAPAGSGACRRKREISRQPAEKWSRRSDFYRRAVDGWTQSTRKLAPIWPFTWRWQSNIEEARAEYPRAMELNPAAPWAHAGLGSTYLLEGKLEEAASAAQADTAEWARLTLVACVRWSQKRIPESDAALDQLIKSSRRQRRTRSPTCYAYRG